jgi:hypothetical protein
MRKSAQVGVQGDPVGLLELVERGARDVVLESRNEAHGVTGVNLRGHPEHVRDVDDVEAALLGPLLEVRFARLAHVVHLLWVCLLGQGAESLSTHAPRAYAPTLIGYFTKRDVIGFHAGVP